MLPAVLAFLSENIHSTVRRFSLILILRRQNNKVGTVSCFALTNDPNKMLKFLIKYKIILSSIYFDCKRHLSKFELSFSCGSCVRTKKRKCFRFEYFYIIIYCEVEILNSRTIIQLIRYDIDEWNIDLSDNNKTI